MSKSFDDAYVRIWKGYKLLAETAYVMRSGFQLIGIAEMNDDDGNIPSTFKRRDESILEHAAKVCYLCTAFMSHLPNFFDPGADLSLSASGYLNHSNESPIASDWAVITTALLHDVGEIATGDIPDDGNMEHESKDESERILFDCLMAPAYSREDFSLLRKSYADFQDHQTLTGQAIYCLDKLEAILQLIWLEQFEVYGLITAKPASTAQDLHFSALIGTPCATDVWAAHTKARIKDLPDSITRHAYELLRVAVVDVRGEWFPWWDKI